MINSLAKYPIRGYQNGMADPLNTLHARAYAKINWDLRILGKRPDGFHELDSVFVNVGLNDAMTFRRAEALSLTCSDPTLPVDDTNLVIKAAKLLMKAAEKYGRQECLPHQALGAAISLEKNIPMGGGLGGGSSDAACALRMLNKLWELNWSVERLAEVAAQVGSDVAYFLYGGWCLCRGRGEIVTRLPGSERWPAIKLLMVLPPLHVATPAVYKALGAGVWDGTGGREEWAIGQRLYKSFAWLLKMQTVREPPKIESMLKSLEKLSASIPQIEVERLRDSIQRIGKLSNKLDARTRQSAHEELTLRNLAPNQLRLRNDLSRAAVVVEPKLAEIQSVLERFFRKQWLMSGSGASHFAILRPSTDVAEISAALNEAVPGTRVVETETIGAAAS
ncbi:MAG TPA: 4-(cytidine 5'-diphospho)-2-C-methyl-D-erythritol kinase [Planctomycetota bacterium]|nr:4-(cytidine 5'-diphospho)-2-C-methyl-D-erythritol kinase [Planctomycetota bacterium]